MADAENQFMETSENGNEENFNGDEIAEEAAAEDENGAGEGSQIDASKGEEDAGWEFGAHIVLGSLNKHFFIYLIARRVLCAGGGWDGAPVRVFCPGAHCCGVVGIQRGGSGLSSKP